jgi:hypothetical protein
LAQPAAAEEAAYGLLVLSSLPQPVAVAVAAAARLLPFVA